MNCSSFFNCKVTTDFSLSIYGSELPKTGNAFSANLIDHSHPFNRVSSCCCDCLIVGRMQIKNIKRVVLKCAFNMI